MADDVGVLVARVVADTEQFRSEMLRVSNQLASNTAKMNSSLAKVQESGASLTKTLDAMKGVLVQLGVAFSIGAIVKFAKDTLDAAANLQHLSERLNISVESLSELQYVAKITDVSFDSLTRSMSFMVRTIGEAQRGTKAAVDVFAELGLSFQVLSKLPVDQQFQALVAALQRVDNEAERSALAVKVFSKSGQEMLQIVNQGPEALRAMMQEARAFGGTTSEMAKAAADAKDAFDRLGFALQSLANTALPTAASAMASFIETVRRGISATEIEKAHKKLNELYLDIAKEEDKLERRSGTGGAISNFLFGTDGVEGIKKHIEELKAQAGSVLNSILTLQGAGGPPGSAPGLVTGKPQSSVWDKHDAEMLAADQQKLDKMSAAQLLREQELQQGIRDEAQKTFDLEIELQNELNDERRKATDMMIDNVLREVREQRKAEQQRRDLIVESSAVAEYAAEALMALSQGHNKKLFDISKKVAIASTIVNTASAIMKAYAELGPIAGTVAAVALAATGLLQIQRIRSTQFDSGAGATSAGSAIPTGGGSQSSSTSSTAASTALQKQKRSEVTIQFMGPIYGWDDYIRSKVIDSIRDAVDGRDVVIIGPNSRQAQLLAQP